MQLTASPETLGWGAVEDAVEYTVFLGRTDGSVRHAGIGSPHMIGVTADRTLTLPEELETGQRYYWRVDALTTSGPVRGEVYFFDLPFQSSGNPIIQPEPHQSSGPRFGTRISTAGDDLMLTQGSMVRRFEFDWREGSHHHIGDIRNGGMFSAGAMATGPGVMVAGVPGYSLSGDLDGIALAHRKDAEGDWIETSRVTAAPGDSVENFGSALAYGANQLLLQSRPSFNASGRVFSHFEYPDWSAGVELVPDTIEENDAFGRSIVMDDTRALVGAPGRGRFIPRKGSAFIFEYDAAAREWRQHAHLRPVQGRDSDQAGNSLALAGNHAAIGSGNHAHSFEPGRVHVFTRTPRGEWQQSATLTDPHPDPSGSSTYFGQALAIHGDVLFVSAPSAGWRGREGGVVYPYRYNGVTWMPLPPIVPPWGAREFGLVMMAHKGWFFVTQSAPYASSEPGLIHAYRVTETTGHQPVFATAPPTRVVAGRTTGIEVLAEDPDGKDGLVFQHAFLPPGLSLEDQGDGRAMITGTPTGAPGSTSWLRIAVADALGNEAVQTSRVTVVAADDLPVLGAMPGPREITEGGGLLLKPRAGGSGPFEWQWHLDGEDIPGANDASLVIDSVGPADSGRYSVTVSNIVGSVTSSDVVVTVRPRDRFTDGWTSFGGDGGRHGFLAADLGRHIFQEAWQAPAQQGSGLNPAVIADGRVFVTPRHANQPMQARAYDLATGDLVWTRQFEAARSLNPPTWHDGRLYLQRSTTTDSDVWCLDAATGEPLWNETRDTAYDLEVVPAVDDDGVFAAVGGAARGLLGYDIDGSHRFDLPLAQIPRVPVLSEGRLFGFANGRLTEINRDTGDVIWSWQWQSHSGSEDLPLIRGNRAYIRRSNSLYCLDIEKRRVLWEAAIPSFRGIPALAGDRVYAISSTSVYAFSADDGSFVRRYHSQHGGQTFSSQPVVLGDHLVASSTRDTIIFNLDTGEQVQRIPHGGSLSYAGGHLVIAGSDNILRAYLANAAPEFAPSVPFEIDAGGAADDLALALGPFAIDPDPGDSLTWSIEAVSRPGVFRTLEIDAQSGDLTVIYNPWESGGSDVTFAVEDSAGNITRHTTTFRVPEHPDPQLEIAAMLVLNRQTGLYEHAITVTNTGAREVAGFDLDVTGLPEDVTVHNASQSNGDGWAIHHRRPLAAGESVELLIEYFTPVRGTELDPQVSIGLVTEPQGHPQAPEGGLAVDRFEVLDDGSVLVEFTTEPGSLYEVHYSHDGALWHLSPVRVRAAGNRVQWIDSGPPRTSTPPAGEKSRFYRVREIPAE